MRGNICATGARCIASCAHDEVRERRLIRRHPTYKKPELLAEGPNEVWSWDITYLRGPDKLEHYPLYTVLDIFSRYVVGWMIAEVESSDLAKQLIAETARKQGIQPDQLTCTPTTAVR